MFKIIKESQKGGAIENKTFYEIEQRILKIMKKLEITNSFTMKDYGEIMVQTEIMLSALETIELTIDNHIDTYIEREY